jgi:purine-cytosine permease-like protein
MAEIAAQKDEVKEDYALERVPEGARRHWPGIFNITVGVSTAMVFMNYGALMAIQHGTVNAIIAEIYATIVAGGLGMLVAYYAAKNGFNVNIMARGAGYGYVGASLTSLIYATNFIMYFGLEGSIMAAAIHAYFQVIPLWLIMIVVGIGIIPLNWYGIRQLDAFQKWSIPIYIILLIGGIGASMTMHLPHSTDWISYLPAGAAIGGGGLLACLGMMNGSVGIQALLVSDYGRFIRKDEFKIGSFFVGFGSQFVCFFVAGLIGIWFGVRYNEVNPGVFFVSAIGVWGALFAILTQLRINVTNMYSGSLSLSNFFEHIFHFVPGRVFWVATTAIVATVAMLFGILNYLGPLLTWQGVFLFAWLASLLADIIVVKGWLKIGTSAAMIEYRPSHLRGWNPVGVVSLIISCAIGTLMVFGVMGSFWASTAAFASAVIELILYLLFSVIANGRFDSVKPLPKEEVLES